MSYIDVTGKTEDEALRKGLEQLAHANNMAAIWVLNPAIKRTKNAGSMYNRYLVLPENKYFP